MSVKTKISNHGLSRSVRLGPVPVHIHMPTEGAPRALVARAPFGFDIAGFAHKTLDGSCTVQLLVNGVALDMEPELGGAAEMDMPSDDSSNGYVAWIPAGADHVKTILPGDEITVIVNDMSSDMSGFVGQVDCVRAVASGIVTIPL